jgi:hypothetical protein
VWAPSVPTWSDQWWDICCETSAHNGSPVQDSANSLHQYPRILAIVEQHVLMFAFNRKHFGTHKSLRPCLSYEYLYQVRADTWTGDFPKLEAATTFEQETMKELALSATQHVTRALTGAYQATQWLLLHGLCIYCWSPIIKAVVNLIKSIRDICIHQVQPSMDRGLSPEANLLS